MIIKEYIVKNKDTITLPNKVNHGHIFNITITSNFLRLLYANNIAKDCGDTREREAEL